jgi:hypothetical protein
MTKEKDNAYVIKIPSQLLPNQKEDYPGGLLSQVEAI